MAIVESDGAVISLDAHGHFVLSPVSLASRDQDGGPSDSTINIHEHLRSHGKIGDCEQSNSIKNIHFLWPS